MLLQIVDLGVVVTWSTYDFALSRKENIMNFSKMKMDRFYKQFPQMSLCVPEPVISIINTESKADNKAGQVCVLPTS